MNIRFKAGLLTTGILASCAVAVLGVTMLIELLTKDQLLTLLASGMGVFFIYLIYSITLRQLEYEKKLEEIKNKK